jgi:hypothetical protein
LAAIFLQSARKGMLRSVSVLSGFVDGILGHRIRLRMEELKKNFQFLIPAE